MKRPSDYLPLLRDAACVGRSLLKHALCASLAEPLLVAPGEVRGIVERFHPDRVPVRVTGVWEETPSTKTFRLAPLNGSFPPFVAGQYVNLYVEVNGVQTSRPYSISSSPGRLRSIEITVRRVAPGFVGDHLLNVVRAGDTLAVSGPSGELGYDPLIDTNELVLVAGGSGVAPFMSVIEDVLERALPVKLLLLYGSRAPDDVIFRGRLEELGRRHPERLECVHVMSDPPDGWTGERGLLDRERILRHVPREDLARKTFLVCGPHEMCQLADAALVELGVPRRRVRVESYGVPSDVTQEEGWPTDVPPDQVFQVTLDGSGESLSARAGETLMSSLERRGVNVPSLCRKGDCGTCRARLLSGEVFTPARVVVRQSDRIAGVIHPCISYPLSDVTLRLG